MLVAETVTVFADASIFLMLKVTPATVVAGRVTVKDAVDALQN